jgi:hypothetical protein
MMATESCIKGNYTRGRVSIKKVIVIRHCPERPTNWKVNEK